MIIWAGRLIVLLGAGHTLLGYLLTAPRHAGAWFGGRLWNPGEGMADMDPAMGAFWMTTGSFGIPLVLVGLTVLWLDRRDIVPPSFIGWTLGVWSVLGAVIFEPAPWPIGWVAAGLLIAGSRRAARTAEPVARPAGV